jgi:hypothetical protein
MKCPSCDNDLYQTDLSRGQCPYCYTILKEEETDYDTIIDSIEKEWGIPNDLCEKIVALDMHEHLSKNMFITVDGEVFPANNEQELKEAVLDFIMDSSIIIDIDHIFVNGISKGLEVDISFIDHDEMHSLEGLD